MRGIDTKAALNDSARVREIVKYTLEHFDQKTKRGEFYALKDQRLNGFNSIFAVSSIPMVMKYYTEFKRQVAEAGRNLSVATIFSYNPNEEDPGEVLPDESLDTDGLDPCARDFLEDAIADYNRAFCTNFDSSSERFQNYYKDLSMRVKAREVDLLIVVNMFLTGFDATTLNTLWVDKNLRMHGLLQAYSRTNRILNSVKTFGNIVCFRDLEQETNDALSLFGNKDARGIVLMKSYDDYYNGYEDNGVHCAGYAELVAALKHDFPRGEPIVGEQAKKDFIKLFSDILRVRNILSSFDAFAGNEILEELDYQDYQGVYIDRHQELSPKSGTDREKIIDDIVFEMELIRQVEINIDYILKLVEEYRDTNNKDKSFNAIRKAISSSTQLRSKKDLIENFIETVNTTTNVGTDWRKFVAEQKETCLAAIIKEENLKETDTRKFIDNALRDGTLRTTGTDLDLLLPPAPRFGKGERTAKKQNVIGKLMQFFEKFLGIV